MICGNCNRENPGGSVYCLECGARLGQWIMPDGLHGAAAVRQPPAHNQPPQAPSGSTGEEHLRSCPRCGANSPGYMRFCTECGHRFDDAGAVQPDPNPMRVGPTPAHAPLVCWRCRGVADAPAEYCRYCGARFADGPGTASAAAASPVVASSPMTGPANATAGSAHVQENARRAEPNLKGKAPLGPTPPYGGARPTPLAGEANAAIPPSTARLVAIQKDGSDGRVLPLYSDQADIGRTEGDIQFSDDPYLSTRHARLRKKGDTWTLRDLDSVNGVYIRIREPAELQDGDVVLIGQQVLRFEVLTEGELPLGPATQHGAMIFGTPEVPRTARLVQITTEGIGRDVHYLHREETVLGRENGDIVFTDDPFLSRRHAVIATDRASRRFVLRDLGSSNGSAVRLRGEWNLAAGDHFRVGRHLFRFDLIAGHGNHG